MAVTDARAGVERIGAVMLVALALLPAACREKDEAPPALRVRLLTSVAVSGRWERAAERGLGRIGAELGADVERLRADDEAARREHVASLGREGVEVVFCVGPGFANVVYTEASLFPDTSFVLLPGRSRGGNVAGIGFVVDGVGFLAGVVAATLSEGSVVGVLRGAGGPWLEDLESGFAAGFRSRVRRGEVVTADGADGPWSLVEQGAEVALYAADRADTALLAAAHDAGLLLVATDPELVVSYPDVVGAAVDVDVAEAMVRVAREVQDGVFTGRVYAFDVGSGVLDLELGPLLVDLVEPNVREALEDARADVTAGFVELEQLGF